MTKTANFVSSGSRDIAFEIFKYCDAQTLGQCCKVNNDWKKIASDERLWKKILPELEIPQGMTIKQFIDSRGVKSKDEVAQRAQEFFDKIQRNQKGIFVCLFPFNSESIVKTELLYGRDNAPEPAPIEEVCIFMKKLDETEMQTFSSTDSKSENQMLTSKHYKIALPSGASELSNKIDKVLQDRVTALQPGFFERLFGL
jgi:hypothetical protein